MSRIRPRLGSLPFSGMIRSSGTLKATDPRDHLYAFMGHPSATTDSGLFIEPNYNVSFVDSYTDVTFRLLQHTREAPCVLTSVVHVCAEDVERIFTTIMGASVQ